MMSPIVRRTGVTATDFDIRYTSEDFPSSYPVSSGTLSLNWNDLLWAALTIGRPNVAYVFQHGDASIHEALFRVFMVKTALGQVGGSRRFQRTAAFKALDPTEKGAVSYFLGMAVCKLFASRVLDTPWLLHLDVFGSQLSAAAKSGRSRPDLIGQNTSGDWHVFETKGRSGSPSTSDKLKAKNQAQRLVSVNGAACALHVGSFAFFRKDALEFYWRDPEPEAPEMLEPISIKVSDRDWAECYTHALALEEQPKDGLLADQILEADIKVEIHPKLRSLLRESRWADARRLTAELSPIFAKEGYQADGVRVLAGDSWPIRPRPTRGRI
jgi:hypothetical protein